MPCRPVDKQRVALLFPYRFVRSECNIRWPSRYETRLWVSFAGKETEQWEDVEVVEDVEDVEAGTKEASCYLSSVVKSHSCFPFSP